MPEPRPTDPAPIHVDPQDVLDVMRARAAQTYAELLDEIARLTAYARSLEKQNQELRQQQ